LEAFSFAALWERKDFSSGAVSFFSVGEASVATDIFGYFFFSLFFSLDFLSVVPQEFGCLFAYAPPVFFPSLLPTGTRDTRRRSPFPPRSPNLLPPGLPLSACRFRRFFSFFSSPPLTEPPPRHPRFSCRTPSGGREWVRRWPDFSSCKTQVEFVAPPQAAFPPCGLWSTPP